MFSHHVVCQLATVGVGGNQRFKQNVNFLKFHKLCSPKISGVENISTPMLANQGPFVIKYLTA